MTDNGGRRPVPGSPIAGVDRAATEPSSERNLLRDLVGREFDPHWYLTKYPEAAREIGRGFFSDALDHYVRTVQVERRSPNADFDESFYLEEYPDVAGAVRSG